MSTYLFEEALADKGLKRNELPSALQNKINDLAKISKDLDNTPDDDEAKIDSLNKQMDDLDELIAQEIKALEKSSPADLNQPAEKKDNTMATVGIMAGVGLLIWGAIKFFGGKK